MSTHWKRKSQLAYIVNALIRVIDSEKEEKRLSLRDLLTIDFANGGVADWETVVFLFPLCEYI